MCICRCINISISFSTWKPHNIHSVPYQPHSFSTVPILSGVLSTNSLTANSTSSCHPPVHISASFLPNPTTASLISNENTPPLNLATPNEVLCTCCGIYINHGMNKCMKYPLHQHQQGQKYKVGFASVYLTPSIYSISLHYILQI